MKWHFNFQQFFYFTLCFIAFTAIGTVSHELGHVVVAEILGFNTDLHFSSMNWYGRESTRLESFWITLGGPLQSMSTAMLGWFILVKRRIKIPGRGLPASDWFWLFLALFWLRPLFNLFWGFGRKISGAEVDFFGGDEARLSELLGLPIGSLSLFFALVALFFCGHILFKIIPLKLRLSFILAGLFGSVYGFWLWTMQLGPLILP
jgi:hypothetical protein